LVDISLDFSDDLIIEEVYPYPLPDLFAGEQLIIAGRYRTGGKTAITLRGAVNGEQLTLQVPNQELVQAGGEPFVARLWATRKIGALLDQVRRTGPQQELINEITELSLQFGIVTPYTSYLVVEPEVVQQGAVDTDEGFGLYSQAADAVEKEVTAAAAAPASGEMAVAAAETRSALANAVTVRETGGVRYVNGKTFVRRSIITQANGQTVDFWIDTSYVDGMPVETVVFGSQRYFELARQPQLAPWLAISSELVLMIAPDKAIRVTNGT
jgi:Ca-activated chloride channel homolog